MTRILLLGASGRTGLLVLAEALARSHSKADISAAFNSAPASDPIRAVVSTLNNGRTSDLPWAKTTAPAHFMEGCARNVVEVMKGREGCRRVVWLGTMGVGDSREHAPWWFNWIVDHSNLSITFADHHAVQLLLEAEAARDPTLVWTDVRAGGLNDGARKPIRRYGDDGKGLKGWAPGMISRDSVAGFLVDCVEKGNEEEGKRGTTPVVMN